MGPLFFERDQRPSKLGTPTRLGARRGLIDIETQSARLHREITQSKFRHVANAGHMVHQSATALVMAAIDEAEKRTMTGKVAAAFNARLPR